MQFSNTVVALYAIALAGFAAAQNPMTVATPPSVVQCRPAALSWSGGTPPYYPAVIPGQQPAAAAIKEFPQQQGNTLTWIVDLIARTSITLKVTDSTGNIQYSSDLLIQDSSDASCVNTSVSVTASGGPAATDSATTAPTSSAVASASSAVASASSAASSAASSVSGSVSRSASATPAPSASSAPNSGSTITKGTVGVAALAGLIGAALF